MKQICEQAMICEVLFSETETQFETVYYEESECKTAVQSCPMYCINSS